MILNLLTMFLRKDGASSYPFMSEIMMRGDDNLFSMSLLDKNKNWQS